jgi:cob(I)alamin adenosyltransferase
MKLYTRTGDDGTTALFGGRRVRKDALRVEAYGAVDETNAALGMARSQGLDIEIDKVVAELQRDLFDVGADLATPHDAPARASLRPVDDADVAALEA